MIPLKFRQNSGPKPSKLSPGQQPQKTFPMGFHATGNSPTMPGSMPGSMPSAPQNQGYNTAQRKPAAAQVNAGIVPGSFRSPLQPPQHPQMMLRQRTIPPGMGSPQAPAADPRLIIVDHIIRDCYSKLVVVDGKNVPEVRYNTHLLIREYSLYPQTPPPADLSPAQIGLVKTRILVVCTKHTGRILLQKGKFNDQKKVYQIGRTWDLDELVSVSRVANDSFILQLNKNYYWKSADDPGRLIKFLHHLCIIYHRFVGHYPELVGFTLDSLGLPANIPGPGPGPESSQPFNRLVSLNDPANHYKEMDFTVNGKLPVKPMQVMDVDRPSPGTDSPSRSTQSTRQSTESVNAKSTQPTDSLSSSPSRQLHESPKRTRGASGNLPYPETSSLSDSKSFVFAGDEAGAGDEASGEPKASMPTILEYARKNGLLLPLRKYKHEKETARLREASENLETAALYGLQLENHLGKGHVNEPPKFQFNVSEDPGAMKSQDSDSYSIEEASLSDSSVESRRYSLSKKSLPVKLLAKNTASKKDSVIDDSIREIEDFMVTQFGKEVDDAKPAHAAAPIESSPPLKTLKQESLDPRAQGSLPKGVVLSEASPDVKRSLVTKDNVEPKNNVQPKKQTESEKDPEIEELLDEIGWNPTDGTDQCVKMLRKELTAMKHKNVVELTTLDFGKDSLANEVATASGEVDNLVEIFKKMEISFKMIAPQINSIENNSKGLQVEAVNKKILYNELCEILNKVKLSDRDLKAVANYDEFGETSMIPILEGKLLMLFDALGAIGNKTSDEDLSQMQALKQFHETYERVSLLFVQKYLEFITNEFKRRIEYFNKDVSNIFPESLLPGFRALAAFAGVNIFVRSVSERDIIFINEKFNSYVANLMDNILVSRIKSLHSGSNSARNSRLTYNPEAISGLKKNKSTRFGSTRILGRISGSNGDNSSKPKLVEPVVKNSDEIGDARVAVGLVKESTDFMLVVQYLLGTIFQLTSENDFATFVKSKTFEERRKLYEEANLNAINYKTNLNDILKNMNQIFGNYINKFTREVTPTDLITIQVLLSLYKILAEAERKNQDFVAYSFVTKLSDRYRGNWDRFISHQVDLFNKSDIRAKGGVLPAVRNLNQIIATIESSLQDPQHTKLDMTEMNSLILQSYELLTKAASELVRRDDPLLKSNSHDEKERAHRNVAILQNLYSILQQVGEYESSGTSVMKKELGGIFTEVEYEYFDYIIRMHLGRVSEFVHGYSEGEQQNKSRSKKEDKILVRGISSSFTFKEVSSKINDMFRKVQKHVVSSDTVFEHDLLDLMWTHLEEEVEDVFRKFYRIAKTIDKDIEEGISAGEIRRQFNEQQKLK